MPRPERPRLSWLTRPAWAVCVCFAVAGCRSTPPNRETALPAAETPPSSAPQAETHHYEMKGNVVAVDISGKKLTVDHENIPGFMGAMTIPYQVKDVALLEHLAPGLPITATVVSSGAQYSLEDVKPAPPK